MNSDKVRDPRFWTKWHNSGAVPGRKNHQTLEQLFDRKIAQSLGVSIETVRNNMEHCSCCWDTDFRMRMREAVEKAGKDPSTYIHGPLT